MSWSASVSSVEKAQFANAVDAATPSPAQLDEHMAKQHEAAKDVAKTLAATAPGPKLTVSMAGHANGVGEQAKPGWSNDYITVTVSQVV